MRNRLCEIAAALTLLCASPAAAGLMSITNQTFRMISPSVPAAGYFELLNLEDTAIVLTGATSPACGEIMMHQSSTEGGMARMRDVTQITLQPHHLVSFRPGGYHLMCMNPSATLMTARTVPIQLHFRNYGPLETSFSVTDALGHPH